jgi:DNA (cytosine-5)-methyltransferase 1
VTAFAELDKYPSQVLAKNFPNIPNYGDVTKVKYEKDQFDVIVGGFPCTDISIASQSKEGIYGKRSFLWKEFFRAVGDVQPKYCVIENVQMLVRRGLNTILSDLASIGYDATYTTLDAQYCGTAQRRRRIYILGVRDGIPAHSDILQFGLRSTRACQQSVELVKKSFEWNFKKGMWFKETFAYFTRQRSDQFDECGVSSTLTKRDYKSFTDLVVSNGNIRRVTPTERLRLMGFPDDWHIENASNTDKYKYNGMHVPSVRYIAKCLKEYHKCLSSQK